MRVGLRRNVTIGLSLDEHLRIHGAAALAGLPFATYLKWLVRGEAAADAALDEIEGKPARPTHHP